MRISIHDVAERAGVSPGTVSHTLNGNDAARIAPATRERVRRAAAELGYRPNSAARSLGRGKTGAIGLLLGGLKNPFFVEALETMERLALAAGYRVLLEASPSEHGTYSGYAAPPEYWPVDGVIAWSHSPDEARAQLGAPYAYLPLISIGGRAGAEAASFDYAQGGRLAAERLLTRGRGRLAYVSPYAFGEDRHEEPRHIGFAERCAAAGVRGRYLLTNAEETRAAGLQVAERIAAFTAVRASRWVVLSQRFAGDGRLLRSAAGGNNARSRDRGYRA